MAGGARHDRAGGQVQDARVQRGEYMSERRDTTDADWPLRPWLMAAICAVAGLVFSLLGLASTLPLTEADATLARRARMLKQSR